RGAGNEALQRGRGGATVERGLGGAHAVVDRAGPAARVDGGARIEHREVAARAVFAGEDRPRGGGVLLRGAAGHGRGRADVQSDVARLVSVSLYSLDADLDDLGASAGAHLVQPVVAGHYQRSADRSEEHTSELQSPY